jgi:hypothetical protein
MDGVLITGLEVEGGRLGVIHLQRCDQKLSMIYSCNGSIVSNGEGRNKNLCASIIAQ